MKKLAIILGLTAITALAGCSNDVGNNRDDIYEESGNTINVNNKRNELYNEGGREVRNMSTDFGYVRHQKSPIMGDKNANDHYTALNREQLAHIISTYSSDIPNVNDVATLVTDQEVLIAYHTDTKNRDLTADQVKRTAMSVVPRYYHIYVTDNRALMRDVENLSHLDSTTGATARSSINSVIRQMKKSPQGARMSPGEDANGLTKDDIMYENEKPNLKKK